MKRVRIRQLLSILVAAVLLVCLSVATPWGTAPFAVTARAAEPGLTITGDEANALFAITATAPTPQTGDHTPITLWIVLLVIGCVGIGLLLYFKVRAQRKKK